MVYLGCPRHTREVFNKLCKLLVHLNTPETKSRIIIILKDASNISEVISNKGFVMLKSIITKQNYGVAICNIITSLILGFDTI